MEINCINREIKSLDTRADRSTEIVVWSRTFWGLVCIYLSIYLTTPFETKWLSSELNPKNNVSPEPKRSATNDPNTRCINHAENISTLREGYIRTDYSLAGTLRYPSRSQANLNTTPPRFHTKMAHKVRPIKHVLSTRSDVLTVRSSMESKPGASFHPECMSTN